MELGRRAASAVGGPLVPKRGVVERTFAWRGRERIHSQDDARLVESSAAQVKIRRIHRMLRRLSNARYPDRFR